MNGRPLLTVQPPVEVRLTYHPSSGKLEVFAGNATADQVLVALLKATHVTLLSSVRPFPQEAP